MKKVSLILSLSIFFISLLIITGCEEKKQVSTEATTKLYSFIPENASGFLLLNVDKFSKLKIFDKVVKGEENKLLLSKKVLFKNYMDLVESTGVDPKKDLHSVGIAFFGETSAYQDDMVAILNINYNREKILEFIKKKSKKYIEEKYQNIGLHKFLIEDDEEVFSFIDGSTIVIGNMGRIKQVIDLSKGKGKNVLSNKELEPYFKELKLESIATFIFEIPKELKTRGETSSMSPIKVDFSKAEMILGFFDYENNSWTGELRLISHNEEGNRQTVSSLNMFKGMGALAGPEVAELLNNINITSSSDDIRVTFTISDELLE